MKPDKIKTLVLEELKRIPIVQIACDKVGIGRATYYRWRKEDPAFTKDSEDALLDGSWFINDMAESRLISAIKDANISAITYWLKHHHAAYANKLEVIARDGYTEEALTPEEQRVVDQALRLVRRTDKNHEKETNKTKKKV